MPFPKDGDDAVKAEWRKAQGLPENAQGYVEKLALPDGVVIGEADKPLVASFAEEAFKSGATQGEVDRAVSWYYAQQATVAQQRADMDGETRVASEVALRGEWKGDYPANMNAMSSVLDQLDPGFRNALLSARAADGQMLGNTPGFIKAMAQLGRELNPAATIIPRGDGGAAQTIENELKTIAETYRKAVGGDGESHRAYYGNDGKPGLDARERELIDMQQKMAARSRAA